MALAFAYTDIVPELMRLALMFLVVPVWLLAGLGDYLCHRASRIERASGVRESVLHIAQFIEAAVPLLAVLFLEVNAGVVLLMLVFLVLHQATAVWDVRYANDTRTVSSTEQHIHGVMEMVPFFAVLIVGILDWPAVLSLLTDQAATFVPQWKQPALPVWYLATVLAGAAVLALGPYGEELLRCLRARRRLLPVRTYG